MATVFEKQIGLGCYPINGVFLSPLWAS